MKHHVLEELKTQAQLLNKYINHTTDLSEKLKSWLTRHKVTITDQWKLKDSLSLIALRHGFKSWQDLVTCFEGKETGAFGDFWLRPNCGGFLCHWFVRLSEAKDLQKQLGGYLLGYRNQFLVVESEFIRVLGGDPESNLWKEISNDAVTNIAEPACHSIAAVIAKKFSLSELF